MLMRWDPFRELDRLTEAAFAGAGRTPTMAMDAYRRGDEFVVQFDLPGIDANSLELTVEKNVLSVKADRQRNAGEGLEWVVAERPSGSFSRQLFLGETLDPERISAHYDHGVLTLTIPVAEQAKPRQIEVAVGNGEGTAPAIDTTSSAA